MRSYIRSSENGEVNCTADDPAGVSRFKTRYILIQVIHKVKQSQVNSLNSQRSTLKRKFEYLDRSTKAATQGNAAVQQLKDHYCSFFMILVSWYQIDVLHIYV